MQMQNNSYTQQYDYLIKIVLVGTSFVGKSNILLRYTKNIFNEESQTTVGVQFASKKIIFKDKIFKLQIWDTAGQDKFKCLTKTYYKGAAAALLVYDITKEKSFEDLKVWYRQIKQNANVNQMLILLIGNKLDLESERKIKSDKGLQFSRQKKMPFYQVSALNGTNIDLIFSKLIQCKRMI